MRLIRKLSDHIEEEIRDARCYAKWALELKESNRSLADTMFSLSQDEMRHMQMLHDEVTKIVEEYRRNKGEPPEEMQAVYDYLHQKHIDEAKDVRILQGMYRE